MLKLVRAHPTHGRGLRKMLFFNFSVAVLFQRLPARDMRLAIARLFDLGAASSTKYIVNSEK